MALQAGGSTLLNWHVNTKARRTFFSRSQVVLHHPARGRETGQERGQQITKKECRSRTPFVSPEIFLCDLIAGKESSRAHDEERCPAVYCKSKGNRPTDEWYSRHSERSRQTDEITAQRSIIECPFDDDDDDDDDDGDEQDRVIDCDGEETEKKRRTKKISNSHPPNPLVFPIYPPFYRLTFASLVNCASTQPRILRVGFSISLTVFHFGTRSPKDFPARDASAKDGNNRATGRGGGRAWEGETKEEGNTKGEGREREMQEKNA